MKELKHFSEFKCKFNILVLMIFVQSIFNVFDNDYERYFSHQFLLEVMFVHSKYNNGESLNVYAVKHIMCYLDLLIFRDEMLTNINSFSKVN